jgi:hypothetical protein
MKAYWLSRYTETRAFELHSPWWCSGYADGPEGEELTIMVAAVLAESEEAAWEQVRLSYDHPPDEIQERFIQEIPLSKNPFSGRFPEADWMAWDPVVGITCGCPSCLTEESSDDTVDIMSTTIQLAEDSKSRASIAFTREGVVLLLADRDGDIASVLLTSDEAYQIARALIDAGTDVVNGKAPE